MKKIVLPALVILGFIGISFYAGFEAEKNIREQLALVQPYATSQGMELTLHEYHRGVFTSNFVLTLRLNDPALPEELSVTSHSDVRHGPLMIVDGLQWGLFYSQSDISVISDNNETNQFINAFFGETLGQFYVHGHFDGAYTAGWDTDAIDYSEGGTEARVDGFKLSLTGRFDAMKVAGTLAVGAINFRNENDDSLEISPVSGEFTTHMVAGDVPLSDADMRLDKITFSVSGSPPVVINKLAYSQRQQVQNNAIDSHLNFTIDSVESLVAINKVYYRINLDGMPIAAAQAWASANFADGMAFASEMIVDAMRLTLADSLNMQFAAGAELLGGRSAFVMNLSTLPSVQGYSLDDIQNIGDMIHFIAGDAELRITAEIVTGSMLILFLAEYIDTYLIRDGDDYVFTATIEEGVIRFADVELPLAMLLSIGTSAAPDDAP